MNRRKRRELLFQGAPHRERIEKDVPAVDRGDEELRPERLFDLGTEDARDLETSLFVDTCRSAPAKAIHTSIGAAIRRPLPLSPTFSQIRPLAAILGVPTLLVKEKDFPKKIRGESRA